MIDVISINCKKLIFAFIMCGLPILLPAQHNCDGGHCDSPHLDNPTHIPIVDTSTSGGISADPNEIVGPTGYGDSVRWVSINDVLNYTIYFENDPDFATAHAQKVDVRFPFADKAAMRGFGLGTYGFANRSWTIADAPAAYQDRLDLRDSMNIFVDVSAGVDVTRQQAFWTFNSIDPETGLNPWQVDRGMLPVNDSTHMGEGFVAFRLKPQENLKTGDTISIQAAIVFDQNDTIPTNRWRNTVDAGNPTSKVKGQKDSKNENLYHLTLEAADDDGGSGLRRVLLYQANNFGTYEEVAECPLDTVIDFLAEPGHEYKFYSIAEDNTGNREPLKEAADLTININAAPTGIFLSDSTFQDDIAAGGFIAELTSEDIEEGTFTYALAEGDGAIHNDLFQVTGTQLQAKSVFKCADDSVYKIRLSTTDKGGLSFSKAFELRLKNVLVKPVPDTVEVSICEGEAYEFHGKEYDKPGTYTYSQSNDYMCDSVYVLQLSVLPRLDAPKVTVEGAYTLVSSAEKNNQWFKEDGTPVKGANSQKFTPAEDGTYYVAVGNGSCFSGPSQAYRVQVSDNYALSLDLAEGWNWISTNLADSGYRKVADFIKPIEERVERVVGFNSEIVRDPQAGLTGSLTTLSPTEGYLLQANEQTSNTWNGHACKSESTPLSLRTGWNWIGFTPMYECPLAEALASLSPDEGDVVKDHENFATFSGGQWIGTLSDMRPGSGYMYKSGKEKSFCYPAMRVFPAEAGAQAAIASEAASPWHIDAHLYPYNMTMIAKVKAGSSDAQAGYFTIGAFSGSECRGIGRYIGDKLFMTIFGDVDSPANISFRALDNSTGTEYAVEETVDFANAMIGSYTSPFTLTVSEVTDIMSAEAEKSYQIYPNPLRTTMYISGDLASLKSVSVISNNGEVVARTESYNAESGLDVSSLVPDVYIAVLHTSHGTVVKKVLKAK